MLVTYVFSVVQTFGGVFFRVFVYVLVSKSKTMSICVLVDVHDHVGVFVNVGFVLLVGSCSESSAVSWALTPAICVHSLFVSSWCWWAEHGLLLGIMLVGFVGLLDWNVRQELMFVGIVLNTFPILSLTFVVITLVVRDGCIPGQVSV